MLGSKRSLFRGKCVYGYHVYLFYGIFPQCFTTVGPKKELLYLFFFPRLSQVIYLGFNNFPRQSTLNFTLKSMTKIKITNDIPELVYIKDENTLYKK